MSDDLHGLVQHLGLAHFHVVATAAGGIGGLDYAVEHLERVRSLVVANSIGGRRTQNTWKCSTGSGRRKFSGCQSSCANSPSYRAPTPRARAAGLRSSTAAAQRGPRGQGSSHGSP